MVRITRRTASGAAFCLGLALATSWSVLATPAAASYSGPGWVDNYTGRTLRAAQFGEGGGHCHVWNKNGDGHAHAVTWKCHVTSIRPHSTSGVFNDEDGVTVMSSGYYWVRWNHDSYHKVKAGVYTRFHSFHKADCYSGPHVKCTITPL